MATLARKLEGKTIVVSGGTKGVGRASVLAFVEAGARVVFGGRDESSAKETLCAIHEQGGEGLFVHTELLCVDDCRKLFDEAASKYGRIDGFFNYAGVTPVSPLDSCDEATFDLVMNVNFRACFFCCQQAIRYMRKSGGGSIVLTGSAHAWNGMKDRAVYACSKGTLLTLMEHIAHNYGSDGIRCNYLALGWTRTEGEIALKESLGESEADLIRRAAECVPLGRIAEPEDYNDALVFLMSDASELTSGSIFRMTGGLYI